MTSRIDAWCSAARLRTLPLALSAIFLGSALAALGGYFRADIFALALLTALLLQILSNFANDYGDALSGADNDSRVGPLRTVQSGLISQQSMRLAIAFTGAAACTSGLVLILQAFGSAWWPIITFIALGGTCVTAAVRYTMGSNPYGYRALGDLAVFVFFGLVAVLGCFALYRGPFAPGLLLPAASCGLLATAVLNINNIRDMQTDAVAGKHTLAMRLGARGARCYHLTLVGLALLLSASWLLLEAPASLGWLAFLAGIPLGAACRTVWHSEDPVTLNRMLKHTALGGFAFNSLFALGILSG